MKEKTMQTLTIRVNDRYAEKLYALLELFPKNALKIETLEEKRANELEKHKRAILEGLDDVKNRRVTPTGITVNLKS